MKYNIRCRYCNKPLATNESILLNAHSEIKQHVKDRGCEVDQFGCSYMTAENVPNWMKNFIQEGFWTKGKIYCPHCKCRIGTFNFIDNPKCYCEKYLRPPIRLVDSKIDVFYTEQ